MDECHRGNVKEEIRWRKVLEYFFSATQIGMTATPKEISYITSSTQTRKTKFCPPLQIAKQHIAHCCPLSGEVEMPLFKGVADKANPKKATAYITHADKRGRFHTEAARIQILLEQQENFSQTKRNEPGAIPNSLPNSLIKFLSDFWGSLHIWHDPFYPHYFRHRIHDVFLYRFSRYLRLRFAPSATRTSSAASSFR